MKARSLGFGGLMVLASAAMGAVAATPADLPSPSGRNFALVWGDAELCAGPNAQPPCFRLSGLTAREEGARLAVAMEVVGEDDRGLQVVTSSNAARADAPEEQARHCHPRITHSALGGIQLHLYAKRADIVRVLTAPHQIGGSDDTSGVLLPGTAIIVNESGAGGILAVAFASADQMEVPLVEPPPLLGWSYAAQPPRALTACEEDNDCAGDALCVDNRCATRPVHIIDRASPIQVNNRILVRTKGGGPSRVVLTAPVGSGEGHAVVGIEGRCVAFRAKVSAGHIRPLDREAHVGLVAPAIRPPLRKQSGLARLPAGTPLRWPDGRQAGLVLSEQAVAVANADASPPCFWWNLDLPGAASKLQLCADVPLPQSLPASGGLLRGR